MTTIIVAYNGRGVIGDNFGKIPWRIPADIKFFKDTTIGHACVMGRKTWDSIPVSYRPLPGRYNVVVTKNPSNFLFPDNDNISVCIDVESAIAQAKKFSSGGEVFITGGSQIYNYCLEHNLVDVVLASEIKNHLDVDGASFFPNLKELGWTGEIIQKYEDFEVVSYRKL